MQDRLHHQKNKSCWSIVNNTLSHLTPKKLLIFCLLSSVEALGNLATHEKQPLTYEFKVSDNSEHVEHSVGNIIIEANTPIEEILALRQKQREDILKLGGLSIRTVITAGANVESVTTSAYNTIYAPRSGDHVVSSTTVEKNENINKQTAKLSHGSFFSKAPICLYKEVQANATAKWWLNMLKEDAPKIIALMSHETQESIQLTQKQEESFVRILTDLIWLECQKPERQRGGAYLRIDYNGQNWDLIQKAMKEVNFTIKNDAIIQCGVMTVIEQNGKVTFQNGNNIGDVYNPDDKPLDIIDTENYQSPRPGQNS